MSVVVSEVMLYRRVVEEGRKGLESQGSLFQKESFTGGMVHRGPSRVGWYKRR